MNVEHTYLDGSPSGCAYCDVAIVDDRWLFISGLVAEDLVSGALRCGTIAEETKVVLDNLTSILAKYGSDMAHVIRTEVLLADFSDRDAMNAEYMRHFDAAHLPARLCYGNVGLHGPCKVEITAVAAKK